VRYISTSRRSESRSKLEPVLRRETSEGAI
jgi:hypothetical protein